VTDRADDDRADHDDEQLRSGDGDAFIAAVLSVVARRPAGAVAALRAALGRPLQPAARRAAVVGIIRLGEDALLREVAHALRHDDPAVVVGAARILGDVGDRRAVPNLVEALRTDDEGVGDAVLLALGRLGDPAALPWVIAAAEHGFCVESACHTLGVLGDNRAEPVLRRLRAHDNRRVALAAARALTVLQER
jgi:HEAT repeat protein